MKLLLLGISLILIISKHELFNRLFKKLTLNDALECRNEIVDHASFIENVTFDTSKDKIIKIMFMVVIAINILYYILATSVLYSKAILIISILSIIYTIYSGIKTYKFLGGELKGFVNTKDDLLDKFASIFQLIFAVYVALSVIMLK